MVRTCCGGAPPALTCTEKACPLTFTVYVALPAAGVVGVVDAVTGFGVGVAGFLVEENPCSLFLKNSKPTYGKSA